VLKVVHDCSPWLWLGRSRTIFCASVSSPRWTFTLLSSYQSLSDCQHDPAEGTALNQVTQRISRFGQREGLRHNRFDRPGFKQRDDYVPSFSNGRLRLSEHV